MPCLAILLSLQYFGATVFGTVLSERHSKINTVREIYFIYACMINV